MMGNTNSGSTATNSGCTTTTQYGYVSDVIENERLEIAILNGGSDPVDFVYALYDVWPQNVDFREDDVVIVTVASDKQIQSITLLDRPRVYRIHGTFYSVYSDNMEFAKVNVNLNGNVEPPLNPAEKDMQNNQYCRFAIKDVDGRAVESNRDRWLLATLHPLALLNLKGCTGCGKWDLLRPSPSIWRVESVATDRNILKEKVRKTATRLLAESSSTHQESVAVPVHFPASGSPAPSKQAPSKPASSKSVQSKPVQPKPAPAAVVVEIESDVGRVIYINSSSHFVVDVKGAKKVTVPRSVWEVDKIYTTDDVVRVEFAANTLQATSVRYLRTPVRRSLLVQVTSFIAHAAIGHEVGNKSTKVYIPRTALLDGTWPTDLGDPTSSLWLVVAIEQEKDVVANPSHVGIWKARSAVLQTESGLFKDTPLERTGVPILPMVTTNDVVAKRRPMRKKKQTQENNSTVGGTASPATPGAQQNPALTRQNRYPHQQQPPSLLEYPYPACNPMPAPRGRGYGLRAPSASTINLSSQTHNFYE